MSKQITISQGLTWMKTLRERHKELVELRDGNKSNKEFWREAKQDYIEKPTYDVRALDKIINKVALEIRKLDDAIKSCNATMTIPNYEVDESVLGELQ